MANETTFSKTQDQIFKEIDDKLNELYVEIVEANPSRIQVVTFNLLFVVQAGSVKGSVVFNSIAKLKS